MDKTALVGMDIEGGERLTEALEKADFKVYAALWFYLSDPEQWRFTVASPLVDQEGPKKAYTLIQSVLAELEPPPRISLKDISVVSPKHSLIQSLRVMVRPGPGIKGKWFLNVSINNVFIEAAYIYRML